MITHSAKETGQQKEQFGWMLEVTGKWRTGCWTKFEKGWGGGVSKIGGRPKKGG